VRAATYAYFGNSLMAGELQLILIATAIILALLALPLFFSGGRAYLRRVVMGDAEASPPTSADRAEDSTPSPP
jgi:hypothetical protein